MKDHIVHHGKVCLIIPVFIGLQNHHTEQHERDERDGGDPQDLHCRFLRFPGCERVIPLLLLFLLPVFLLLLFLPEQKEQGKPCQDAADDHEEFGKKMQRRTCKQAREIQDAEQDKQEQKPDGIDHPRGLYICTCFASDRKPQKKRQDQKQTNDPDQFGSSFILHTHDNASSVSVIHSHSWL